jgi:transcriptional regulator with XRE-family HTH domain
MQAKSGNGTGKIVLTENAKQTARELGERIRAARVRAKLRLIDVASRTGLTESSLSRIERGYTAVSVMNLVQICEVLSIGIDELFQSKVIPAKTTIAVHSRAMDEFEEVEATGYRWRHLVGGAPFDTFNVFHLVMPKEELMKTMVSHPGQEYCYVMEGEILFYVDNECHRLGPGDGILIDSQLPHRAERVSEEAAHILMTVTRPMAEKISPEWWNLSPSQEVEKTPAKDRAKEDT